MCNVYVYAPFGPFGVEGSWSVHPKCVENITASLKTAGVSEDRIKRITTVSQLIQKIQNEQSGVLVISNGNFSKLKTELKDAIAAIREAVAKGWNYLGISSGAVFASRKVRIVSKNDASFQEFPSLNLYPYTYQEEVDCNYVQSFDEEARQIAAINLNSSKMPSETISICSRRQGRFQPEAEANEESDKIEQIVLARFSDEDQKPVAAIDAQFGFGRVTSLLVQPELPLKTIQKLTEPHHAVDIFTKQALFLREIYVKLGIL